MHIIKKLPPMLSAFSIIIIILVSGSSDFDINVIAKRIILVGILFYLIGMVIKHYIESAITSLQENQLDDNIVSKEEVLLNKNDITSENNLDDSHQFENFSSELDKENEDLSAEEFVPFGAQTVENIPK